MSKSRQVSIVYQENTMRTVRTLAQQKEIPSIWQGLEFFYLITLLDIFATNVEVNKKRGNLIHLEPRRIYWPLCHKVKIFDKIVAMLHKTQKFCLYIIFGVTSTDKLTTSRYSNACPGLVPTDDNASVVVPGAPIYKQTQILSSDMRSQSSTSSSSNSNGSNGEDASQIYRWRQR